MKRRQLVQLAGAALAASALNSNAQSFPAKPIRLIIAFPAGGPTDITMRSLADGASKILGQPVIIDNKPGAGGTLPAQTLQTSAADGYTLAQIPLGVFRLPYTTKINWDPVKDISYVLNVTGYAFGLVVPADSALKTWTHYVGWAKANPGKLTFGSTGTLTSPHLTMELIAQKLGLQLLHVPYKGTAVAFNDLLGGHIEAMVASPTVAVPYIQAGRLRALGLGGPRRQPQVPDIPTFHEAGLSGFDMTCYHGIWFPAGTAPDIIRRVYGEVAKAIALPDTKKYLADNGLIPTGTSPEEFAEFLRKDIARQADIVKQIGLQPQ